MPLHWFQILDSRPRPVLPRATSPADDSELFMTLHEGVHGEPTDQSEEGQS